MKKLGLALALLCLAPQAFAADNALSSRDARLLRLAMRSSKARVVKATNPGLQTVCPNVQALAGNVLYKFQASGHLKDDARSHSCSFIHGSGNYDIPRSNVQRLYDSNGNQLSYFRTYQAYGCPFPFRSYTNTNGPTCSKIVSTAFANTGNRQGYIKISDSLCLKVNNLAGRQGGNRAGKITSSKADCRRRR